MMKDECLNVGMFVWRARWPEIWIEMSQVCCWIGCVHHVHVWLAAAHNIQTGGRHMSTFVCPRSEDGHVALRLVGWSVALGTPALLCVFQCWMLIYTFCLLGWSMRVTHVWLLVAFECKCRRLKTAQSKQHPGTPQTTPMCSKQPPAAMPCVPQAAMQTSAPL